MAQFKADQYNVQNLWFNYITFMLSIVANIYTEEVESKALNSDMRTTPSHWFRYVDDTWVKSQTKDIEIFTEHINSVDRNV